ncbi:MAG: alpha-galactosidase [Chthonomonadaceae bacterium]|nr:alpha-galactosidase [Chthonomonadaceae bacterium]
MYLDCLPLIRHEVGYGVLGLYGELGYEAKAVTVGGKRHSRSFSAHAPSILEFDLEQRFETFRCHVAFNDDVLPGQTSAEFTVNGDGKKLASVSDLRAGEAARELCIRVSGVKRLVLEVATEQWAKCHAVWLDPEVYSDSEKHEVEYLSDCLCQTDIEVPPPICAERCIATVVSPGYTDLLDAMLRSLRTHGQCHNTIVVVFVVDGDGECRRVVARHDAVQIDCKSTTPINASVKSVLYSAARIIDAATFVCLDADTLIVNDLTPMFHALDVCAQDVILAMPDPYIKETCSTLSDCLVRFYQGRESDLTYLLETPSQEGDYTLIVNDGVFAARRSTMLMLDRFLRSISPRAKNWLDSALHIGARNQFLFNLALARLGCGLALSESFNLLPSVRSIEVDQSGGSLSVTCDGRDVTIVHFAGSGRNSYPELRLLFAREEHNP